MAFIDFSKVFKNFLAGCKSGLQIGLLKFFLVFETCQFSWFFENFQKSLIQQISENLKFETQRWVAVNVLSGSLYLNPKSDCRTPFSFL